MAVYTHASHVAAPLAEVWTFHIHTEGVTAVTPDWMGMRVERAVGPGGQTGVEVLEAGSEITLSLRPFGVGPRRRWTSRIAECERSGDRAVLVDRMIEGPFPRWEHTHRFVAEGDGTLVHDQVDWRLPCGSVGGLAAHLGVVGLAPLFRYRHRRTRALLER